MAIRTLRDRIGWAAVSIWRSIGVRSQRGVKAVVLNDESGVLLVLPRYSAQWMLPGGGVRRTENEESAAQREVREESGAVIDGSMTLLGQYTHRLFGKSEMLSVYIGRCSTITPRHWSFEIRKAAFFPLSDLPLNIYPSTVRRLTEYQTGKRNIRGTW